MFVDDFVEIQARMRSLRRPAAVGFVEPRDAVGEEMPPAPFEKHVRTDGVIDEGSLRLRRVVRVHSPLVMDDPRFHERLAAQGKGQERISQQARPAIGDQVERAVEALVERLGAL